MGADGTRLYDIRDADGKVVQRLRLSEQDAARYGLLEPVAPDQDEER